MTLEQSIDLAAFDEDAHPETLDSLETEALIARSRYDDLRNQGLGHLPGHPCGSSDPQGSDIDPYQHCDAPNGRDTRHPARAVFVFLAPDP